MTDERLPEVLGSLPRTRPHRRSQKRPTRTAQPTPATKTGPGRTKSAVQAAGAQPTDTAQSKPEAKRRPAQRPKPVRRTPAQRLQQPAQPAGTPSQPRTRKPLPSTGVDLVGTAVQAAAELAEIGLSASARALRGAVSRLPRP